MKQKASALVPVDTQKNVVISGNRSTKKILEDVKSVRGGKKSFLFRRDSKKNQWLLITF